MAAAVCQQGMRRLPLWSDKTAAAPHLISSMAQREGARIVRPSASVTSRPSHVNRLKRRTKRASQDC